MTRLSLLTVLLVPAVLLAVLALLPAASAQTCAYGSFNFNALSTYDLYGSDGSAGSNEDSLYIVRVCGAVADPVCAAQPSGSMACRHAWPNYQATPNGGTVSPPSSAYCANNVTQLTPAFSTLTGSSAPVWSGITVGNATGAVMTVASGSCRGSTPYVSNIVFLCAPLQTSPLNFATVTTAGVCNFNFTLYTSLACPAGAVSPAALAAPPAPTSSNCGFGGVSFASLSVDINATDDAGRTYVVHPCGAVTISTQYCGYPANSGQQPASYPSACEVTGYCNPFYAAESFGYFNPSASDFSWYALSNGFAYAQSTPLSDEGWTSDSQGCPNGALTTFTFICNSSATTTALTQSTARVFNSPTQCGYVVQLQTSLACSGSSSYLPTPSSSFSGMGYDLSSLTGYDIYAAQSGVYNGQFSQISFCVTMFNASSASWTYSARGVAVVAYTLTGGTTIQSPSGQFVLLYFSQAVLSTAAAPGMDVNVTLLSLNSDGSDNLLNVVSGSTTASPDGGGVTLGWTSPTGQALAANLYAPAQIDSGYPYSGAWTNGAFTITAQYYDPSNPSLISCNTASTPVVQSSSSPDAIQVAPDYYYINLAGVVKDPTCAAYTAGGMVCQRWGPTNCTRTEVGAVWQPSVLVPSWTYVNGKDYTSGIQLAMWATNPLYVQQQSGALGCYGLTVRIQFVCAASSLRPYVASSLVQSSSSNFACTWTIVIPTYLLCTAPGQSSMSPPNNAVACGATVNGHTFDLSSLSTVDVSAYDASNTQYVYRACAPVANAWCQGSLGTHQSQLCSVPQACTQSSSTILLGNIAGAYNSSAVQWSAISNGLSQQQSTGDQCTATCGGQTVYSGPRQSTVNFVCSSNQAGPAATATVTAGSYDSNCNAVNGGSCSTTMNILTAAACGSTNGSVRSSTWSSVAVVGMVIGWLALLLL